MAVMKLSNKKRRQVLALAEQALTQAERGQYELALRICAQADHQHKDFPEVMYARAMIASSLDDYTTAAEWFGKASHANPKNTVFLINYASSLLLSGQEDKAAEIYPKALAQAPRVFEKANGYASYASALDAIGEFRRAIDIFEKGLKLDPRNVLLLKKAASHYSQVLETETALTLVEQAHAIAPNDPVLLYDASVYLMQQGKVAEAKSRLRDALSLKPDYIEALALLVSSSDYEEQEADVSTLQKLYEQQHEGTDAKIMGAFVLGKAADKGKNYDQAFAYWAEANSQRRQLISYHEEEQEELHSVANSAFPATRFAKASVDGVNNSAPIFIIGMPRCGSTLLEQALLQHPELVASGESDAMQQAIVGRRRKVRNSTLIKKLASMDETALTETGHEYVRRLTQEYGFSGRVVDKTLFNYLYVGLIARALPHAHIIHVSREPVASCLSMFQENFAGGSIPYSFDLEELGRQYTRYLDLMQHWREVLPAGAMLEVSYENLVSNTEVELRRLLAGCNLEWHEGCLASHKSTGAVATASMLQVRKPMHQKSVARWKHYKEQLTPLKQYLQP